MKFKDLHELINTSYSAREFFLSLPVSAQMQLHEVNEVIRTERDLIEAVNSMKRVEKQMAKNKTYVHLVRF